MRTYRHPDWEAEKDITKNQPKWKENLLSRVSALLGEWGSWADKVGFRSNEVQIQYKNPIDSYFSYTPLGVLWVRFNTWDPQTKRPATRAVRFGPDTATLMVLVKIPNGKSYEWYLLARKKYQFAGKDLFVEFSRGWMKAGIKIENYGWKLFERDFPGLRENPSVASIYEERMGNPIWENDADLANKTSKHLIVIEMLPGTDIDQIQKELVDAKLHQENGEDYPDYLDEDDLVSKPVVFTMDDAASLINSHIMNDENAKLAMFGEDFTEKCWDRFMNIHGWQFPQYALHGKEI